MASRRKRGIEKAEVFPDDIIGVIVLRVPVKSILRFRCVCKRWCALIDSHDFVKQHLQLSILYKTHHTLFFNNCFNISSVGLYSLNETLELVHPLSPNYQLSALIGSCNGLICLSYHYPKKELIIWNPTTRKHVKVPKPIISERMPKHIVRGFGCDSVSDDYKVVMLVHYVGDDKKDCTFQTVSYVYSMRSNEWWNKIFFPGCRVNHTSCGALACGALHLIVSKSDDVKFDSSSGFVGAVDLVTEEYKMVPLPGFHADEAPEMILSELGGCLSVACYYKELDTVDVWVMKDYGVRESWTKLLTFSKSEIRRFSGYDVFPLSYSENGEEVLIKLNDGGFIWYNLEKRTHKFAEVSGLYYVFRPMISFESLVSLGGKAENDWDQK